MYMLSYVLIVSASLFLRSYHTDPVTSAQIRCAFLTLNLIVLTLTLGVIEMKSIIANGLSYLNSFWNKNDVMLFFMSMTCLIQEIIELDYQKKTHIGPIDRTVRPPSANGGFDFLRYYKDYDPNESYLRVTYSILLINSHLKTLNVLSFYSSVAFIIKAMESVFYGIRGYGVFYLFLVSMYALCYNSLDLVWTTPSMNKEGDA